MPITEEQRKDRKNHIGGSDMAAILGLDKFKTAEDVRLEKCGKLIDQQVTNAAMDAGNYLEDGVLNFAETTLGKLIRNQTKAIEDSPIVVNTDAVVVADSVPVEAKTTGILWNTDEWWGADGTDEVPDRVIVQATCHMLAWKAQLCHVPSLIGGRGFVMYAVPWNKDVADVILEAAGSFWVKNVLADTPCENSQASLQVVKMLKRTPNKVVGIDPLLVEKWLETKEEKSKAEKAAEAAQAAILAALGDAEAGQAGEYGAVTYLEQKRAGYTVKDTAFRVLRLKKGGL